jgi:hypothetical protein
MSDGRYAAEWKELRWERAGVCEWAVHERCTYVFFFFFSPSLTTLCIRLTLGWLSSMSDGWWLYGPFAGMSQRWRSVVSNLLSRSQVTELLRRTLDSAHRWKPLRLRWYVHVREVSVWFFTRHCKGMTPVSSPWRSSPYDYIYRLGTFRISI